MTSPRQALRDLKIGVRLAAAFAACGLLVGIAAYLGLSAQSKADGMRDQLEQVASHRALADLMLININDITGWQGLYLADATAFGTEAALSEDGYNRDGYLNSKAAIEEMFAEVDTTGLTA